MLPSVQAVSDFKTLTKSSDIQQLQHCLSSNKKNWQTQVKCVMETFESFEHWLKGTCLYKCSICSKDHHDFIDFGHHIEIDHEISVPAYIQGNMQLMRSNLVIFLTCFSLSQGVLVRFYICTVNAVSKIESTFLGLVWLYPPHSSAKFTLNVTKFDPMQTWTGQSKLPHRREHGQMFPLLRSDSAWQGRAHTPLSWLAQV